ncbi:MAG: ParB/RepB/Spo0J family partition protein [Bacilli bacterium]|nr:ParB/RepB/Spo0J family partition protein [Bacilli bacterium]
MNKTEVFEVPVEQILPNRFQPRLMFDDKSLAELANSIKIHGIIQPLVVRRLGDKYEIIAGERRYKAANLIGLRRVPVIIINADDNKSAEMAVVENIQRKEMTALEEAKSFKKILDKGLLTQEQLAIRMGKSQSSIANKLRLLNLSEEVQEALMKERISERHARSLLRIDDKEKQIQMLNEIIANKLNVKETDEIIKKEIDKKTKIEKFDTLIDERIENFNDENPQIELMTKINNGEKIIEKPIQLDSEQLKKESFDIKPKEEKLANIENLMESEFEKPLSELPKNKFLFNFDNDDFLDVSEEKNIEKAKDLNLGKQKIKECVEDLNKEGYKINLEEFDYEKNYQIIIKIEKE